MTTDQMVAWIQVGQVLAAAGIATWGVIKGWIASRHQDATEEQLNAILEGISADAKAHKALADADAAQG